MITVAVLTVCLFCGNEVTTKATISDSSSYGSDDEEFASDSNIAGQNKLLFCICKFFTIKCYYFVTYTCTNCNKLVSL